MSQRDLTRNQKVDAALQNELVTRQRVTTLENTMTVARERITLLEGIVGRRFFGRLRWLFLGR